MPSSAANTQKTKKTYPSWLRKLGIAGGAAAIFLFGWGLGSNRIHLGPDAAFRKSVNKNLPANLDYFSVEEVYDTLKTDYDGQLDTTKLLDGLKQGLAQASGDNYTEYMNPKEAQDFNSQLNGTFSGIGAELSKENNVITIVSPIAGTPADRAGIKAKDVIASVNGQSTDKMTVDEAVRKIRGPKGTKVKLTIVRDGSQQLNLEITRDDINVPSVKSEIMNSNIGYLTVSRFDDNTALLARQAALKFKDAGVRSVILDLRGNPGGVVDGAVGLSSLWLKPGQTVLSERRSGIVVRTYEAQGDPLLNGIPTVVLINEGSASASEITAGALHDNHDAYLIGQKSFGKGSVQQLEKLQGGGLLKVTIARWYTPAGRNIDKEGIEPDKKVEFSADDAKAGKDPQKDAATLYLQK